MPNYEIQRVTKPGHPDCGRVVFVAERRDDGQLYNMAGQPLSLAKHGSGFPHGWGKKDIDPKSFTIERVKILREEAEIHWGAALANGAAEAEGAAVQSDEDLIKLVNERSKDGTFLSKMREAEFYRTLMER